MIKVLYPGSFDPITKGHMNIIEQASFLFDEVIVGILNNPGKKNHFFTVEERLEMIKELYKNNQKISIISSEGAAVDVAKLYSCKTMIRGLRSVTDFEQEIQLAQINKDISDGEINTICLFADTNLQNISSSTVKAIFSLNKNISKYVDPLIEEKMYQKVLRR